MTRGIVVPVLHSLADMQLEEDGTANEIKLVPQNAIPLALTY